MTIDTLVKAHANVDARNEEGFTPLHWAAALTPNPAIFEVLLMAGVKSKMKTKMAKTTWDYVTENQDIEGSDAYWRLNESRF